MADVRRKRSHEYTIASDIYGTRVWIKRYYPHKDSEEVEFDFATDGNTKLTRDFARKISKALID